MIKNWEDVVPKRTDPRVMKMIPRVGELIENHVGKNNQIYSDQIVRVLQEEELLPYANDKGKEYEMKNLRPYVTKAVNAIRMYHLIRCVASTSKGYFIASTPEEWEEFLCSANGRATSANALLISAEQDMAVVFPDFESEYVLEEEFEDSNEI